MMRPEWMRPWRDAGSSSMRLQRDGDSEIWYKNYIRFLRNRDTIRMKFPGPGVILWMKRRDDQRSRIWKGRSLWIRDAISYRNTGAHRVYGPTFSDASMKKGRKPRCGIPSYSHQPGSPRSASKL